MGEAALRVGVLTIGTELTSGQRVDTNSAWVSRHLEALGLLPWLHRSCPDDREAIALALRQSAAEVGLLIVTGGLGPTSDDLTRDGAARALGVPLELHAPSWERIQAMFARFGREPTPSNRRQAEFPAGARVLDNDVGTAPGFTFSLDGTPVYVLPGVPREVAWLWEHKVEPELRALAPAGPGRESWSFRTVGIAESALGERLGELEREPGLEVRYAVEEAQGTIQVTLLSEGGPARAQALRDRARALVGEHLCAEGRESLAEALVRLLLERGLSVVTAESCTGGRVAAALTAVPGVSAAFREGLVAYANQSKTRLLGVPAALIEAEGAVSEAVARAMAEGARARADADLALGVTGIAGPDGGTPDKPVGLVHLAVACRDGRTLHLRRVFPGARDLVQARATAVGLDLLRRAALGG